MRSRPGPVLVGLAVGQVVVVGDLHRGPEAGPAVGGAGQQDLVGVLALVLARLLRLLGGPGVPGRLVDLGAGGLGGAVEVRPGDVQGAVGADERLGELVLVAGAVRGRQLEGVGAGRAGPADQHPRAEALAVVGRGPRPDVGGPVGRELGPGDVDPVAERAAAVVVDGQQLLVLEHAAGALEVGALNHRPAREVPGRAGVAGGAVQVDGAGGVGHRGGRLAPVELQAGEVEVAAGVGGNRGVAGPLPVLAGRPEGVAAGEAGRHLTVGPGPPAVAAVGGHAARVAPAVVVVPHDQVPGGRVDGHRGLVVGLGAAGQVDVGQVEAVAVGLDVAPPPVRAAQAVGRQVGGPGLGLAGRPRPDRRGGRGRVQLAGGEPGQDPPLDLVELVVAEAVRRPHRPAARKQQNHAGEQRSRSNGDKGSAHRVLLDRRGSG